MGNVLAENLKRLRLTKKLTQEQVAEQLGVSTQSVSRWECGNTYPDVMLLPEIARLYSVTVDDLYKKKSVVYDNYAQRLVSVYEATRDPEDFLRADAEFQKQMKCGEMTAEDYRTYGIMHQFMMNYCMDKAIYYFDKVIDHFMADTEVRWKTRQQKQLLLAQIGRGQESVSKQLRMIEAGSEDLMEWVLLLGAFYYVGDYPKVYEWYLKACDKFPEDSRVYIFGGDACQKLGKTDEAFRCWDRALQIDPDIYDARFSLGFCYEKMGEYQKAHQIWCDIAERLKKEGFEAELDFPLELARKCKEKIDE